MLSYVDCQFLSGTEWGRLAASQQERSRRLIDGRWKCEYILWCNWFLVRDKPGCFAQRLDELLPWNWKKTRAAGILAA